MREQSEWYSNNAALVQTPRSRAQGLTGTHDCSWPPTAARATSRPAPCPAYPDPRPGLACSRKVLQPGR
ncbi:hypothetical protein HZF09_07095 [Ramlibacter sp. CGMCC 1.13660]|nr:hypothetical protein [Ramlibacter sp. CGMCC 1.13660]